VTQISGYINTDLKGALLRETGRENDPSTGILGWEGARKRNLEATEARWAFTRLMHFLRVAASAGMGIVGIVVAFVLQFSTYRVQVARNRTVAVHLPFHWYYWVALAADAAFFAALLWSLVQLNDDFGHI